AGAADAVVRLGGAACHLIVAVDVLGIDRRRVVLVVVEIPARDVVDVAVAVVVVAVGEEDDGVFGVDQAVAVGVGKTVGEVERVVPRVAVVDRLTLRVVRAAL